MDVNRGGWVIFGGKLTLTVKMAIFWVERTARWRAAWREAVGRRWTFWDEKGIIMLTTRI
jgi:hypothetical protein